MKQAISTLLVSNREEPFAALKCLLEQRSIKVNQARTCVEASHALKLTGPPHLIFTGTTLPDGTWADVLALAANASEPVNVIVVAPWAGAKLYVDVIERGAFDFIVPCFGGQGFDHVLRCAVDNILRLRDAKSQSAGSRAA